MLCIVFLCAACSKPNPFEYSGTLQSESANVGSTIGGRVTAVYAGDGQRVSKGQLLIALDDSELRAEVSAAAQQEAQAAAGEAQAKAVLDRTQTAQPHQLRIARDSVRQAQAGLAQATASATQQSLAFRRAQWLFSQGAIAAQAFDDARASDQNARAAASAASAALASARTQLAQLEQSSQPQDLAVAARSYQSAVSNRQAARANVMAAQSRLREMFIRAPADGIIDALDLRPGDIVAPRAQVAAVREFIDPYVRIYVPQRDLGGIQIGKSVRVRSDALGGEVFGGTIEQIDQDAQFTPRDVQTEEDRADLSFGVKVRVHDPYRRLQGGTTVEVALQ